MVSGVSSLLTDKKLDDATLEELEDLLIASDLGVSAASQLKKSLSEKKFNKRMEICHSIIFRTIFMYLGIPPRSGESAISTFAPLVLGARRGQQIIF